MRQNGSLPFLGYSFCHWDLERSMSRLTCRYIYIYIRTHTYTRIVGVSPFVYTYFSFTHIDVYQCLCVYLFAQLLAF